VGDSPTGVKVRSPVTRVACVEETKCMKPTDKAIFGMVSELPGRNKSEPTGGLVRILTSEAELAPWKRRHHGRSHPDRSDSSFRRGGRGGTATRTYQATGEAVLVPSRNRWSRVGRITGNTGKSTEDETVAAGFVVAMKRGNARGAKGPCCTQFFRQEVRQG